MTNCISLRWNWELVAQDGARACFYLTHSCEVGCADLSLGPFLTHVLANSVESSFGSSNYTCLPLVQRPSTEKWRAVVAKCLLSGLGQGQKLVATPANPYLGQIKSVIDQRSSWLRFELLKIRVSVWTGSLALLWD